MLSLASAARVAAPNLLSAVRLLAGPCYLVLGEVPASLIALLGLGTAAATDLFDGWMARSLGVTSRFGAFLDTSADKIFALALLAKLWLSGVLSGWIVLVVGCQYLLLPLAAVLYLRTLGSTPKPSVAARVGASLAVVAVLSGLIRHTQGAVTALALLTIIANCLHLAGRFSQVARARRAGKDVAAR